jgi:hypothetical protein
VLPEHAAGRDGLAVDERHLAQAPGLNHRQVVEVHLVGAVANVAPELLSPELGAADLLLLFLDAAPASSAQVT